MTDPHAHALQWKTEPSPSDQPFETQRQQQPSITNVTSANQNLIGLIPSTIPAAMPAIESAAFSNFLPGGAKHFYQMPNVPVPMPVMQQDIAPVDKSALAARSKDEMGFLRGEEDLRRYQGMVNAMMENSGISNEGSALPDDSKLRKIQQMVEAEIDDRGKQQISQILEAISTLKAPERLLLYLRLPGGTTETDPLRQPQNPLGTRSEINHTINWIRSHLEHDPEVSIPKQEVYDDYIEFCQRVEMKPLSTADFGKVMKQVFPEIRPRRLGTRGNSRYCYAAMRKTTKLAPPQLPELASRAVVAHNESFDLCFDEDAWKIVKVWSEGLLNARFMNIGELSTHISKHNLNTPASNSSRFLLQKKLIQREAKDKRKNAQSETVKKRRKKRNQSTSSSESLHQRKEDVLPMPSSIAVKEEIEEFPFSQPRTLLPQYNQPQLLPMNLATESDRNAAKEELDVKEKIPLVPNAAQLYPSIMREEVKAEIPDCQVFCKKVRQAQQIKGLWNGPISSVGVIPEQLPLPLARPEPQPFPMGPPAKMEPLSATPEAKVASRNSQQLRAKKLRYLQAKYQSEEPPVDVDVEKEILSDNLGLPRERVISICNMDKHELDDYLNGEESQEQEAELLQYFQPEEATPTAIGADMPPKPLNAAPYYNTTPTHAYHDKRATLLQQRDRDQITQLRQYLHQNLNKDADKSFAMQKLLDRVEQNTGCYSNGLESSPVAKPVIADAFTSKPSLSSHNLKRKCSNSPVGRDRNRSFVPISPNSTTNNEYGLFASPRTTPLVRKLGLSSKVASEAASAPPSPSLVQRVGNPLLSATHFAANSVSDPYGQGNALTWHQNAFDLESRSQSVPLHGHFTEYGHFAEYPSAGSSVAQTPIPQEFADFNDPSTILEILSDSSQHFKELLCPELDADTKDPNLNTAISRSVPCTPLPKNPRLLANFTHNGVHRPIDISKSVPTTPIGVGFGANLFRYSPEYNTDFLINGSTVDTAGSLEEIGGFNDSDLLNTL